MHHRLLWIALALLTGCHAQVGPTLGYAPGRGVRFGWEGGGGIGPARGNIGQTYGTFEFEADQPAVQGCADGQLVELQPPSKQLVERFGFVTYAAFEPALALPRPTTPLMPAAGGTIGGGFRNDLSPVFLGGGWAGGVWIPTVETLPKSVVVGVRYIGGDVELYVAPKVGLMGWFFWFM